jgi:hypothetical protein
VGAQLQHILQHVGGIMPETMDWNAATCNLSLAYYGGATTVFTQDDVIGSFKSISALNNQDKFVPGKWLAHPVTIKSAYALSSDSSHTELYPTDKVWGALGAYAIGAYNPLAICETAAGWDSMRADHTLVKAYGKLKRTQLDVGVYIGELKETLAGFAQPLKSLKTFLDTFNKLQRSSPRRMSDTLDMLSGSWLEWRYGIMPVIYQIRDIIEHFERQLGQIEGKLYRKHATVKWDSREVLPGPFGRNIYPYAIRGKLTLASSFKVGTAVGYSLHKPVTWAERYGLDMLSMPSVAWELLTLSFVVDWFYSVGAWLKAMSINRNGLIIHGSTTSQKSDITLTFDGLEVYYPYPPYGVFKCPGNYQMRFQKLERRLNQALPSIPTVNPKALDLKKQIDALTLIWGRLPKALRPK